MYTLEKKDKNPFSIAYLDKLRSKKIPFGSSENRFFSIKPVSVDFSPSNFEIQTLAHLIKKKNKKSKSVFGTTEKKISRKEKSK